MKNQTVMTGILTLVLAGTALGGVCLATGNCREKVATVAVQKAASKEAPKEKAAPSIDWQPSLESAIKESKRSGKPIFVDFHATWCPPCKMMEKQTFTDAKVIAESQKWVMLKIDTDKQPDLAVKYGISSLPTLAALRSDGQPITGTVGFTEATEFIKFLRFAASEVARNK